MKTGLLTRDIASKISVLILSGEIDAGAHLSTQRLANKFGVSRSPVREAMKILAEQGILEQKPNRGFFARKKALATRTKVFNDAVQSEGDANLYHKLAEDWLNDKIPGEATEQQLRERYKITKTQLQDVLVRAVREGWAEQKQGYGWRFLPVAKTPEAFEQIYRFRMLIEPAAMFEPGFSIDRRVLENLRRGQEHILSVDIDKLPVEYLRDSGARYLLDIGSQFHEELIKLSGNHFFYMSLVRVNRMRRLLEYRGRIDRVRFVGQSQEHLKIISLLEKGDILEASNAMRQHLRGALMSKSPENWPQIESRITADIYES